MGIVAFQCGCSHIIIAGVDAHPTTALLASPAARQTDCLITPRDERALRDAIAYLLRDKQLRRQLGANGKRKIDTVVDDPATRSRLGWAARSKALARLTSRHLAAKVLILFNDLCDTRSRTAGVAAASARGMWMTRGLQHTAGQAGIRR